MARVPVRRLWRAIKAQDIAWLSLIAALGAASPTLNDAELELLCALAALQIAGPRVPALNTPKGVRVAIALKLILGYLLIGVSGGVTSSYYLILLVPVVSAGNALGPVGVSLVTITAALAYLSFLLFVDWSSFVLLPQDIRELCLRIVFLGLIAFLTYQSAAENRRQAEQYRQLAEQLAETNRSLQQAEREVRRSERLAALGQLTAGLAHELRNPLSTMRASAELLERSLDSGNEVARELARFIVSEVDRLSHLINRFLDFARPMQVTPVPRDLNQVVDRAIARLENLTQQRDVQIYRNYAPDLGPVAIDAELMEIAVYNLLENAVQMSPPGAPVTVKTRRVDNAVEIAVIDRGPGIPESDREHIFNPFFTRRPNGTGLGLAMVAKIVSEHRGSISVESEVGRGSVFRILLPINTP